MKRIIIISVLVLGLCTTTAAQDQFDTPLRGDKGATSSSPLGRSGGVGPEAYQRGEQCMADYDWFNAIKWFESALHSSREFPNRSREFPNSLMLQATRRLAECHYKTGNFKQALSIAATLPPDSMTHDDLRLVYFCLSPLRGTGGSADSLFYWGHRILKQYPMDAEVAADMAKRYIESEKPEIALKTATEYWLRDSTNVFVNRQLGYAQYLCGQYKEAINTYEQQLIRGDSSVIVLFPLGMCYYLTNDRPNAYIRLKQAAKATDYGNATCLAKLGIVAAQLGHAQESAEYLEKAINLFTPDPEVMALVYENLGDAHLQAGNMRAGIEAYRNCLNHNPEKPYYIYYEMGQAYGAIRDSANERKYFRLFLEETQKLKSLDGLEEAIAYAKRKVGLKK